MQSCALSSNLSGLSQGERLLLRSVRALALGIRCRGFQTQFEDACGWAGPEAFRALGVFVAQVGLKGLRRLAIALPGAEAVTADETLILLTFAAAQAEDYRGLQMSLHGLLRREPQHPMAAAACLVADTLALNGLLLRRRDTAADWAASTGVGDDMKRAGACARRHAGSPTRIGYVSGQPRR